MSQEWKTPWTLETCEASVKAAEILVRIFRERLEEIRELEMDEDEGDAALAQCVDIFRTDMGELMKIYSDAEDFRKEALEAIGKADG